MIELLNDMFASNFQTRIACQCSYILFWADISSQTHVKPNKDRYDSLYWNVFKERPDIVYSICIVALGVENRFDLTVTYKLAI